MLHSSVQNLVAVPVALALALILALSSCDGSSNASPTGPNEDDPIDEASVLVDDFSFDPMNFTADPGEEVVWAWVGSDLHNVTWVDADLANSPDQASGTHEVTMPSTDGEYAYYCTFHGTPTSGMHGSIVVGSGEGDASDGEDDDEDDDLNDDEDDEDDDDDDGGDY